MPADHESSGLLSAPEAPEASRWRMHLALFGLTALTVLHAGAAAQSMGDERSMFRQLLDPAFLAHGASFAVPLLAILVTHEFGHYFAAKLHGVPASLPYFIPLPGMGAGTLGAVISMKGSIRSRNALLDIGAAGPLAGLVVALPVLLWGLAHSAVQENPETGYMQEGQSLLYVLLKRLAVGEIPAGHDVWLHPTAYAGWFGLLLTMLNLLPWGQLDGGHIAYALLGERQHKVASFFRWALLGLVGYNLVRFVLPVLLGRSELALSMAIGNSVFWLIWFVLLGVLARLSGGAEHPPCEPGALSPGRRVVAWCCLGLFVVLFMPTPMAMY